MFFSYVNNDAGIIVKKSLWLPLVCHWVYRENPVLRVPKS